MIKDEVYNQISLFVVFDAIVHLAPGSRPNDTVGLVQNNCKQ